MAATELARAPDTKGNIAIGGATAAVIVIAGQNTKRLTFSCDQVWYFTYTAVAEGAALGAEKVGPIDADRWFEVHIDDGYVNTVYIEAAAAATLQVIAEPL